MAAPSFQALTGNPRDQVLDYEIVQEQAAALGRLGRALEAALNSLAAYDATVAERPAADNPAWPPQNGDRIKLLERAGYAFWCFMVQREACGLRDQATVVREYRVPAEVRNRMGVFPSSPSTGR